MFSPGLLSLAERSLSYFSPLPHLAFPVRPAATAPATTISPFLEVQINDKVHGRGEKSG